LRLHGGVRLEVDPPGLDVGEELRDCKPNHPRPGATEAFGSLVETATGQVGKPDWYWLGLLCFTIHRAIVYP